MECERDYPVKLKTGTSYQADFTEEVGLDGLDPQDPQDPDLDPEEQQLEARR